MKSTIRFACALLPFAMVSATGRAASANAADLSRADLKEMVRDAHTPEQYRVLASYYRMRQQQFADQAHDEIAWFAKRSINVSLSAAKYPTPLDSSRNRYEYFNYEAQKMAEQAAHFENLQADVNQ